jgi:ATP-dependent Clp protease ATP-binding subunit ClpA
MRVLAKNQLSIFMSQFRGQFEDRLRTVLDAVSKLKNVILFIDEFHTMVSAGGSGSDSGGDMTGGNIIKPYLSRGDIQVIGATTDDEYNEYVEKDKAISRRFKKILIQEPNKEETIEIMKTVLPVDCDYFDKTMQNELLERIYTLSNQYNMHTANPDKALTMLESAFAYAKVCKAKEKEVTIEDVIHAIELEYHITVSQTKANDTRDFAKSFLLGQDKPIDDVCKYLNMIEMNIVDPEKPRCSLLLAGPTGVGKTEMAKIIAKHFTGSDRNLITVEGSSMQSETGVSTLFGADAGYVGYKQTSDFLAKVKQTPNCVVLFDEIEKADKSIFKSLLNILDEGYAKDKAGNKISFRSAIIIFTTNLGYGTSNNSGGGIMSRSANSQSAETEINKFFSPEFIGRLDEVITFNRLSQSIADKLIERYRQKYSKLSGISITFSKAEIRKIKNEASIESLGARNLDHMVKVAFAKKAMANNK